MKNKQLLRIVLPIIIVILVVVLGFVVMQRPQVIPLVNNGATLKANKNYVVDASTEGNYVLVSTNDSAGCNIYVNSVLREEIQISVLKDDKVNVKDCRGTVNIFKYTE